MFLFPLAPLLSLCQCDGCAPLDMKSRSLERSGFAFTCGGLEREDLKD